MKVNIITQNGVRIAHVEGDTKLITDAQSALDLAMTVQYDTECNRIVMSKELIDESFFVLSTKIAGEILQKFVNYHVKLAVYGDFDIYTSKPLRDFIYESNQGNHFFFVEDLVSALEKIGLAEE